MDGINVTADQLNKPFHEWQLNLVTVFLIFQILGRVFTAIKSGGGLSGIFRSVMFGSATAAGGTAAPAKLNSLLVLILPLALMVVGSVSCSSVAPGSDPIVVRAEQAETVGKSTFDLILNVDNANRQWWISNVPQFHSFCEWLRQPQVVDVTNSLPRCSALIWSLNDVKHSYMTGAATSNVVLTAAITLEGVVNQAASWMTVATNSPGNPVTSH